MRAKSAPVPRAASHTGPGPDILRGLDLEVRPGEIHAIMGPNGSGKSTLSHVLMGHPGYEVTAGEVIEVDAEVVDVEPGVGGVLARHHDHAPAVASYTAVLLTDTATPSLAGQDAQYLLDAIKAYRSSGV